VPITTLTPAAQQDLQDARNLITRVSDELPLKLAAKAAVALAELDDIENALADEGLEL
jgi:hypothetical protein